MFGRVCCLAEELEAAAAALLKGTMVVASSPLPPLTAVFVINILCIIFFLMSLLFNFCYSLTIEIPKYPFWLLN